MKKLAQNFPRVLFGALQQRAREAHFFVIFLA